MPPPTFERRFGLLQATALNMSNMIGIGPFITIPLLMTALGGPQALLGWLVALVIVVADGLVWAELGAMLPGSGGTYRYLREGFGSETVRPADGLSVHLAVHPQRPAGDRLGLHRLCQLRALHPAGALAHGRHRAGHGGRRRQHRAALPAHRLHRHADGDALDRHAGDDAGGDRDRRVPLRPGHRVRLPRRAPSTSPPGFLLRPGRRGARRHLRLSRLLQHLLHRRRGARSRAASSRDRSSSASPPVAVIYIAINLSIIGVVPWREFVPNTAHPQSDFIVSIFMERIYGSDRRHGRSRCWCCGRRSGRCSRCCSAIRASRMRRPPTARSSGSSRRCIRRSTSRTCRCCSSASSRLSPARCRSAW